MDGTGRKLVGLELGQKFMMQWFGQFSSMHTLALQNNKAKATEYLAVF